MRLIKTYDGITLNCDVIAMIQPVFMNSATGVISEIVNDDSHHRNWIAPHCRPIRRNVKQ